MLFSNLSVFCMYVFLIMCFQYQLNVLNFWIINCESKFNMSVSTFAANRRECERNWSGTVKNLQIRHSLRLSHFTAVNKKFTASKNETEWSDDGILQGNDKNLFLIFISLCISLFIFLGPLSRTKDFRS